MKMRERRQRSC